jgi:3-mercaptopyruvate sulfurtransferase SseA
MLFSGIYAYGYLFVLTYFVKMRRMFLVFGHSKVWVLDGGLPRWRASGYDVESSASSDAILKASAASEAIEKVYQGQTVSSFLTYIHVCI